MNDKCINMGLINVDVAAKSSAKESKQLTQLQAYLISLIKKGDYKTAREVLNSREEE